MMKDLCKQAFRSRPVLGAARRLRDRHEVFRAGEHERVRLRGADAGAVSGNARGGFAADARAGEMPSETERPVAAAGAVAQRQLWLHPAAAARDGYRNSEVARAREEVRRKAFTQSLQ